MSAMASQITSLTIVLLNRLFRRRLKKTSKLRVTGLAGSSPVAGEFPAQMASNAENDVIMMIINQLAHKWTYPFQTKDLRWNTA